MKQIILSAMGVCCCLSLLAQDVEKEVATTEANTLKSQLAMPEWGKITKLTVSGPLGNGDIIFLSNVAKATNTLQILDLSNATELASIDKSAFERITSLTSVSLPSSVTTVGEKAFMDCVNLKTINFPSKGVLNIEDRAFANDSLLLSLTLPASLQKIASSALAGCNNLQEIKVAPGSETFSSIAGVLISMEDETLVKYPVARGDEDYVIPDGISVIGEGAFAGSKLLKGVEFPSSVKTIGKRAFENCLGFTAIILGDGVNKIDDYAFKGCKNLISISMPNKLKTLGDGILVDCCQLNAIRCEALVPPTYSTLVTPFESEDVNLCSVNFASCVLSVPSKSTSKYEAAPGWKAFVNIEGFQVGK